MNGIAVIKSTTPTQASGYSAQCFALYVLIRWLQSALIPFVTTQSVGVLKPPHESIIIIIVFSFVSAKTIGYK